MFKPNHKVFPTSSTLAAVFADVSINIRPCSLANASPSSFLTSLLASKSLDRTKLNEPGHEKTNVLVSDLV